MAHAFHRSFGRAFLLFALASVGVWGCGTEAGNNRPGQATEEPSEPISDGQILAVVSTIDQGEIKNAKTAEQRTANDAVRTYAQRIGDEHEEAETRIQALQEKLRVKQEGSEMQSNLRREADRMAEQLRTVPQNQFDVTFLDAQIAMHQRAITLLDAQLIPNADSAELETFLHEMRSSMVTHLTQARRLRSRFPTPPGGGL
ncbi:DUF4142 domain-containing protein [Polyangium jinanense]|uniref:DUF4142 domain-containing protein n=1 Tax=Polyangium jinanense TaxID=2829994 RepID=A0A9X3XCJ2_9BACT|nr:DUF4142 domain-containing protein [Polyangium jinanense]MDC3960057.1 DUF4142 domain-containing protein [Polyangium jinanense]MDC3986193.1 DUF4142 domain-containing protein [Polyangium jinanense]